MYQDQMQNDVHLKHSPKRIISLVPSQTELLHALGLESEVVGITKFCIHPKNWFETKKRIGGTKQFDFDEIESLQPDLILGNKEENEESQIRQLQNNFPVWMSDIHTLEESLEMIVSIGEIVDREERATQICSEIIANFHALKELSKQASTRTCAYLIWKNPYMAAGPNTFIDSMMKELHLQNIFSTQRYPEVSVDELRALAPELVLLSSEPYPFSEKHIHELQSQLPTSKILLVDGEMFSWYGSRLVLAPHYFSEILANLEHQA